MSLNSRCSILFLAFIAVFIIGFYLFRAAKIQNYFIILRCYFNSFRLSTSSRTLICLMAIWFKRFNLSCCAMPSLIKTALMFCATISSCFGLKTNGVGPGNELFDANLEPIESGLTSNCGEFAVIKIGIVHLLPYTYVFQCITITQPVGDKEVTIFGL